MKSKVQNTEHCQVRTVKYNDRDYRVQKTAQTVVIKKKN